MIPKQQHTYEWMCVFLQQISEMETQYEVIDMKNIFSVMYEGRGHYAGLHLSFFSPMIVNLQKERASEVYIFPLIM